MIYFTADEHYHHENIIQYCNRPWKTIEEMNQALIDIHNSVVTSKDQVYHLGDFCWRGREEAIKIIQQLNGFHYFITGSHDKWLNQIDKRPHTITDLETKKETLIYPVGPVHEVLTKDGIYIFLSHYPHISWPRSYHGSLHLHGHCHGKLPHGINRRDVGVDVTYNHPITLDHVIDSLKERDLYRPKGGIV